MMVFQFDCDFFFCNALTTVFSVLAPLLILIHGRIIGKNVFICFMDFTFIFVFDFSL